MAKVKIKFGENEIEIDSRDFYIDNSTLGQVIGNISKHMQENNAKIVFDEKQEEIVEKTTLTLNSLNSLEDAEIHEPEFNEPIPISGNEIRNKLKVLSKNLFFEKPRTVSETVNQLREYGWSTSPLEVSKTLAKMVFNREIQKDSKDKRNYYIRNEELLVS